MLVSRETWSNRDVFVGHPEFEAVDCGGDALSIDKLFDASGSETHDLIDAVEVETRDGDLLRLQEGDRIVMRIDLN